MTETPVPLDGRPIVVGLDGSDASMRALAWATEEAAARGCGVELVYVHPGDPYAMTPLALSRQERADDVFDAALRVVTVDGRPVVPVTTTIRNGMARRALLRAARKAPMLVLGRHGTGELTDVVMGSTALACATHARSPVTIVPETWEPSANRVGRILLGIDGSARCEPAIAYAFTLAAARGSSITAVHAAGPPSWHPVGRDAIDDVEDHHEVAAAIFSDSLDAWRVRYPSVEVATITERGHPSSALSRHADAADILIVGGRGHGVVTGMLLGSVARAVLYRSPIPVTVIHDRR